MSARKIAWERHYAFVRRRLKAARKEADLTQREVAARLDVPHSWVAQCETGERRVDIVELAIFARLFGKPLDYFTPKIE